MAFTKSTADLANISKLDDEPNDVGGLSAAELKAEFDAAAETLQSFVNTHVTELESSTAAGNIGAIGLDGTTAANVQSVIVAIKALLDACETQAAATSSLALKEDKTVTAQHYKAVTFDTNTGIFTFTRENGSTTSIDTALEKVATNWAYDAATQSLVLTLADGSTQSVSLSAFITENEYLDSDTLDFSVSDHKITATIKSGSITDTMLASALKTTLQNYVTQAGTSATNAATSEANALTYKNAAQSAQTAAVNAQAAAEAAQEDAEVSAANAATSETNAKTSETSAFNSAASILNMTVEVTDAPSTATASVAKTTVGDHANLNFTIPHGKSGVYVGSGDMPDDYNVQIDPNGEALHIINDLTTGGTEDALSAEQGKALNTSISELNADFEVTTSRVVYANLLDKNDPDYSLGKYVDPSSGALHTNTDYNTSGFIPVNAGDRIITTTKHYTRRCFDSIPYIAVYNSQKIRVSGSGASYVSSYVVPSGGAYIRLSFSVSVVTSIAIEKFTQYGISNTLLAYGEPTENIISGVKNIEIFLPDDIYVARGYPIEIYYDAICPKRGGYTIDANISGKGAYPVITAKIDKLQIDATNVGSKGVILSILDGDGNVVGAKLTTIRVVAASAATKTILPIGDSLTDGKAWLAEMIKMDNNISFVGNTSFSVADSGGTARTGKHQGITGVSARKLVQVATSNPFWNSALNDGAGGFSFSYYVTNTLSGVSPDVVIIFLGMNDEGYTPEANAGYVKNIVDYIRADAPTMPIIIVTPQYRSYYGDPQYTDITFKFMTTIYDLLSSYASLYIVPLGLMHDSNNNYTSGTEVVNPRSSITQPKITDVTHPQVAGLYQFADAIFGTFSKYFKT